MRVTELLFNVLNRPADSFHADAVLAPESCKNVRLGQIPEGKEPRRPILGRPNEGPPVSFWLAANRIVAASDPTPEGRRGDHYVTRGIRNAVGRGIAHAWKRRGGSASSSPIDRRPSHAPNSLLSSCRSELRFFPARIRRGSPPSPIAPARSAGLSRRKESPSEREEEPFAAGAKPRSGITPSGADPAERAKRRLGAGNGGRTRDFYLGKVALYH
jgi:hypothetical protein